MKKKPDHKKERIESVVLWECPNCGQHHFGDSPPDMCDYCNDFTTWRRITDPRHDDTANRPAPRGKD